VLRSDESFAHILTRGDVAPGAHNFDRVAGRVADQVQLIADPAVVAFLPAESVFDAETAVLYEAGIFLKDTGAVVRMDAAQPEIRALEIFLAIVAKQVLDVLADEGRRIVAGRFVAVEHRRRASE